MNTYGWICSIQWSTICYSIWSVPFLFWDILRQCLKMNFGSQAELDATIRLRDFFHLFYFASYLVRTIFWSVPILVAITFWSVQLFGLYQFDEWNHLVRTSFHCIYIWSVPTLTSILGGSMVRIKINGRINGTDQNLVRTKSALRSKIGTNQNMVQTKNGTDQNNPTMSKNL